MRLWFIPIILIGCGDNQSKIVDSYIEKDGPVRPESYCGDHICDEDKGEDYWNCIDCSDITGAPKNGYCGDGICFNETMTSCWRDCRPKFFNPAGGFPDPGPAPDPIPMPPGPDPRPMK